MPEWRSDELPAVLSEVARRASVDPDFRALAVTDGAAAIQAVSGKSAPAPDSDFKVDVTVSPTGPTAVSAWGR